MFVEGESDIRFFRKFFDLDKCKVEEIPGGNINLEKCVSELAKIHSFIIGIRDADFIHLSSNAYSKTNMFLTDFHDMEMTMLAQEVVLNALVFEFTDYSKDEHLRFRHNIMKSIEMLSYLKWLNDKGNLELDLSSGFQDLLSFSNFGINFTEYLKRVISKSTNAKIKDKRIIDEKIRELKELKPDLMQLTNGHDLLDAFAAYFREKHTRKGISGENIARSVRMMFTFEHFKETKLYYALKNWNICNKTELFMREASD